MYNKITYSTKRILFDYDLYEHCEHVPSVKIVCYNINIDYMFQNLKNHILL